MIGKNSLLISKSYLLGVICALLFLPYTFSIAGLVIRPFDLLLVAYLFVANKRLLKKAIAYDFLKNRYILLLFFFFLYRLMSAFFLNPDSFLKESIQSVEYLILTYCIYNVGLTVQTRHNFFKGLVFAAGVLVFVTVGWHLSNGYWVGYKQLNEPKLLFGLFSSALLCDYLIRKKNGKLLLVSIFLTLFSLERKGWVGLLGVAFAVNFWFNKKIKINTLLKNSFKYGVVTACIVIPFLFIGPNSIGNQVKEQVNSMILLTENFSLDNYDRELVGSSSNAARLYLLSFSYESFKTHPVIGIGTGNFKKEIEKFSRSDDGKVQGSHNEYQRILVENGLVGLAIYFLIIWMLFIGMKRIKVSALSKGIMYKYHYLLISAVFIYGSIINAFLAGGALNIFFYVVPLALIASYRKDLRNKLNLSYKK